MNEWIGTAITVLTVLISLAVAWTKMGGYVDSLKEDIAKHDKWHGQHFDKIGHLESSQAAMGQKLESHIEDDRNHFERISELLKEGRDDIKEILRTLRNGSK